MILHGIGTSDGAIACTMLHNSGPGPQDGDEDENEDRDKVAF